MAFPSLRHGASAFCGRTHPVRRQALPLSSGSEPVLFDARRAGQYPSWACGERRKHHHHAGYPPEQAEGTQHMAENDRGGAGHAAGNALFQEKDTCPVCRSCPVRGQCGRGGGCILEIFRAAGIRTQLGGICYSRRASEFALDLTPEPRAGRTAAKA